MTPRQAGIAAAVAALLLVAAFGVRQCTRDDPSNLAATSTADTAAAAASEATRQAEAVAAAQRQHRALVAAMQDAVSAVQRYVALLGKPDKAEADAMWSGGRPPARSGEADLRMLAGISGLRVENGTPRALDPAAIPSAFEVPVRLRVDIGDGTRRYAGHYRLRRAITGDRWEITSADIHASPAAD